jgi:hypothetical protein
LIFSFATHHTVDGGIRESMDEYTDYLVRLVRPGGLVLFESHATSEHKEVHFQEWRDYNDNFFDLVSEKEVCRGKRLFMVMRDKRQADSQINRTLAQISRQRLAA